MDRSGGKLDRNERRALKGAWWDRGVSDDPAVASELWWCDPYADTAKPLAFISRRPAYCDRGHYLAGYLCAIPNLDAADFRPNYYIDLDRAEAEEFEWLVWRLCKERIRYNPERTRE